MEAELARLFNLTAYVERMFRTNVMEFRNEYLGPHDISIKDLAGISPYIALIHYYNWGVFEDDLLPHPSVEMIKPILEQIFKNWHVNIKPEPPKEDPPPNTIFPCGQFKDDCHVVEFQNKPGPENQAFALLGRPIVGRMLIDYKDKNGATFVPGKFTLQDPTALSFPWFPSVIRHDEKMRRYYEKYNVDVAIYHARLQLSRQSEEEKVDLQSADCLFAYRKAIDQKHGAMEQFAWIISRGAIAQRFTMPDL